MHTFTKLPVIRPIKIQMHASKYGKISGSDLICLTFFTPKLLIQPQETEESGDPFIVESCGDTKIFYFLEYL